jgi:hypothetical protein
MVPGVGHAADKAKARADAGVPIPGAHDATIQITLASKVSQGKAGTIEVSPNGDRVRVTREEPPRRMPMANVFDEFATKIVDSPNHALLDRIAVVDAKTGALLAEYQRSGTTWNRIR